MLNISPAIIPHSLSELEEKMKIVANDTDWVHVDIADGVFAPNVTWNNPDDLELIPGRAKIEVHLMTEKPEENITLWAQVADRIIVHVESTDKLGVILNSFEHTVSQLGLALLLDTPLSEIEDYLPLKHLNLIQLMGIKKIGHHGEVFDESVLDKITALKKLWPEGLIQVDGGLNLDIAKKVKLAGAGSLVVGSSLWQAPDLKEELNKFKNI